MAERMDPAITGISKEGNLTPLPYIEEASSAPEKDDLFARKLEQCCVLFESGTNSPADVNSKEVKTKVLEEIIRYIEAEQNVISECVYPMAVSMLSLNLFITVPFVSVIEPPGEAEVTLAHRRLAYKFFRCLLQSKHFNVDVGEKHFDKDFVQLLFELLDSEDPTERDDLKYILHAIYKMFQKRRACIRYLISSTFSKFVSEGERYLGIRDLLELLTRIIKDGLLINSVHKDVLMRAVMTLKTARSLNYFMSELKSCVRAFIKSDSTLVVPIVQHLLRFENGAEPHPHCLNLMKAIWDTMSGHAMREMQVVIFTQLARCLISSNFELSHRALWLFYMDRNFMQHINIGRVLPVTAATLFQSNIIGDCPTMNNIAVVMEYLKGYNKEQFERYYRDTNTSIEDRREAAASLNVTQ